MDLDKDRVQEFVDDVLSRYEENSILGNAVSVETKEVVTLPSSDCRSEGSVSSDALNAGMGLQSVRSDIDAVTDCEEEKVLTFLDSEAEEEESIDANEFGKQLFTKSIRCLPYSSDVRVMLPDYNKYKDRLDAQYGTHGYLPHSDNVPIYWFDSSLFPRQGFVVNSSVYVVQASHGDKYSVVNDRLGMGELEEDNSNNRLKIHIGDSGFHPIEVSLWSKFSDPQTVDDESICVLHLPDPSNVDIQV